MVLVISIANWKQRITNLLKLFNLINVFKLL